MNINTDIEEIYNGIEYFIGNLKNQKRFFFFSCIKWINKDGQKLSLGFSCYALKMYYMLGNQKNCNLGA